MTQLRKWVPRRLAYPILDVGCGNGLSFGVLSEFGQVEGVEAEAAIVDAAGPYAHAIHVGPFDAGFRPARVYGLITMLDVLEHFPDPRGALAHALSLLRTDGLVLLTVPAFPSLWTSHDDRNHHYVRFTKRTFARLAAECGLEIVEARYFFHWLTPIKLAIRLKERLWQTPPGPVRVPHPALNRLLVWACRGEQMTLGKLPVPFGSSLLIVGQPRHAGRARKPDAPTDTLAAAEGRPW